MLLSIRTFSRQLVSATAQKSLSHFTKPTAAPLSARRGYARSPFVVTAWPKSMEKSLVEGKVKLQIPEELQGQSLIDTLDIKLKAIKDKISELQTLRIELVEENRKKYKNHAFPKDVTDTIQGLLDNVYNFQIEKREIEYLQKLEIAKQNQKGSNRSKTEHQIGDLAYGPGFREKLLKDVLGVYDEYDGSLNFDEDPLIIDNLNRYSGVTGQFAFDEDSGKEILERHFTFLDILKGEATDESTVTKDTSFMDRVSVAKSLSIDKPEDLTLSQKWLLFLVKNVDNLSLEEEIQSLDTTSVNYDKTKDQLLRNVNAATLSEIKALEQKIKQQREKQSGGLSSQEEEQLITNEIEALKEKEKKANEELRGLLLAVYENKGKYDPSKYSNELRSRMEKWVATAMFRKTSVLGIDFAIEQNVVVHFNLAFNDKGENLIDYIDEFPNQMEPITVAELRHTQSKLDPVTGEHPNLHFVIYPNPDGGNQPKTGFRMAVIPEDKKEWKANQVEKHLDDMGQTTTPNKSEETKGTTGRKPSGGLK